MNNWPYPFDPQEFPDEPIHVPISMDLKNTLINEILALLESSGIQATRREESIEDDMLAWVTFLIGGSKVEISVSPNGIQIEGGPTSLHQWYEFEHEISLASMRSEVRKTLNNLMSRPSA